MKNIMIDGTEGSTAIEKGPMIIQSGVANLPTKYGTFQIKAYGDGSQEHLAIMSQDFSSLDAPIVRIHSECLTGDAIGSLKCDCNNQLDYGKPLNNRTNQPLS